MKYSKTKKQKFSIFAIVYSLVIMLAVLQFGGIIFNVGVSAVDVWDVTTEPKNGFNKKIVNLFGRNSFEYELTVSSPEGLAYAMYVASEPTVLSGSNSINIITLTDNNKFTEITKPNFPEIPQPWIPLTNIHVSITIKIVQSIDMSAKYWKSRSISNKMVDKLTILGNHNLISGLRFNSGVQDDTYSTYTGLIGVAQVPLIVKNLSFGVLEVSNSSTHFGILAGATNNKDIELINCSVHGVIDSSKITYSIGGLIGYINDQGAKSITNCWSYCTIKSYGYDINIGGLVGYVGGTGFDIVSNCANFGDRIISNKKSTIGGLFGIDKGTTSYNKCLNIARLESNSGIVGGLVGDLKANNVQINDSYNNADLSCKNGTIVGGLVGRSESGLEFNRCYSYGKLERNIESELLIDNSLTNKTLVGIFEGGFEKDFKINKYEYRKSNVITSNLCGNIAKYNNSVCVDTKNSSYQNNPTIFNISFCDYFKHSEGSDGTIKAGSLQIMDDVSYKFTDYHGNISGPKKYSLSNEGLIYEYFNLNFPLYIFHYNRSSQETKDLIDTIVSHANIQNIFYNHDIFSSDTAPYIFRVIGISFKFYGNIESFGFTVNLEVDFSYPTDRYGGSDYCITWLSGFSASYQQNYQNNENLKLGGSVSDVDITKLNSNGNDEFAINENINDGLPILKDFYWEYAV